MSDTIEKDLILYQPLYFHGLEINVSQRHDIGQKRTELVGSTSLARGNGMLTLELYPSIPTSAPSETNLREILLTVKGASIRSGFTGISFSIIDGGYLALHATLSIPQTEQIDPYWAEVNVRYRNGVVEECWFDDDKFVVVSPKSDLINTPISVNNDSLIGRLLTALGLPLTYKNGDTLLDPNSSKVLDEEQPQKYSKKTYEPL